MDRKTCIIIPARWGSTRFEGKPLALIGNKPMIQRVYERCQKSKAERVIVATDDQRIFDVVSSFGDCMMTPQMENGTLRVCHVASKLKGGFEYFINVQGDEPFISVSFIDRIIRNLQFNRGKVILTGASEFKNDEDLLSHSTVKLVGSKNRIAIGFTRSPFFGLDDNILKHIGIYGFHESDIEKISNLMPSDLSLRENLEQVRWMEEGYEIRYVMSYSDNLSIDLPSDIKKAEELLTLAKFN